MKQLLQHDGQLFAGTLISLGLFCTCAPAARAATGDEAPLEEVSVTASRVARDGFNAPTPTTVVTSQMIDDRGLTNVADFLNELPAFSGSVTPSTSTISSTTTGQNFANLRNLGISRTLVLLDGKRYVPTDSGGEVDLNSIPTALLDRVEVVTGGASAAWGSDAVGGVVNLITKSDLQGFSGDVQGGSSQRGDNLDSKVSVAYGSKFADDRGHFTVAAEYSNNRGIDKQSSRDWGRDGWGIIPNPDYTPTNGQPARLIEPNVTLALATAGGVIAGPPPLSGTTFGPNGSVSSLQYGSLYSGLYMSGGNGGSLSTNMPLKSPVERTNLYSKMSFDLTDHVTAYGEASLVYSESRSNLVEWPNIANIDIAADNAYLPTSVRDTMLANGIGGFTLGRINDDFGPIVSGVHSHTWRVVAGLKGSIVGDWTWDAYAEKGESIIRNSLYGNELVDNFNNAVDAVVDPNTGSIVCRSTLTNPTNGCVPFNTFGQGSTTRAAYDYVTATQDSLQHRAQSVASVSARGTAFSDWAGPVSVALGAEYRDESIDTSVDANSAAGAFIIGNPQSLEGSYHVREAFVEGVVPVLANLPLAKEVDLNVAARFTDYSTSGSVTTWKAGLTWQLDDALLLRATRSEDIRAPNLTELYTSTQLSFDTIADPVTGAESLVQIHTKGNLALQPEKAHTTTAGFVFQPHWLQGFQASVDYYNIQISGAIGQLDPQDIVDRCANGSAALCQYIARDPTTQAIDSVTAATINLSQLKTSGFDVQMAYGFPLSALHGNWPGQMSFNLIGTHVIDNVINDGATSIDLAGQNGAVPSGGVPSWMTTLGANYRFGPWGFHVENRFISSGKFNNTYGPLDINNNHVPSVFYVNTSLNYTIVDSGKKRVEIYGVINNLFDKNPPVVPYDFLEAAATNVGLYDVVGRMFSVGARFAF